MNKSTTSLINNIIKLVITTALLYGLFSCTEQDNLASLKQDSLIYCSDGSPETFNPQLTDDSATLDATAPTLYSRLIDINLKSNQLIPSIAKSWHVTRDGKKITLYLRKDIHFHYTDYFYPSRALNADDVIFSFQRIIDPEHPYHFVSSGKYPYFERVKFANLISTIEKIDEYTIRFTLNEGDSSFLAHLATQHCCNIICRVC